MNPGPFSCASCLQERKLKRPEVKTSAKRLPHCKLTRHIEGLTSLPLIPYSSPRLTGGLFEGRVMRYLEERVKEGVIAKKDLHEVHIRVLASADKEVTFPPRSLVEPT